MEEYRLERAELNEKWDQLIDNSENGTIFLKSYYLNSLIDKCELYYCYKKNELRAGLALISDLNGNTKSNDLVIYNGIIYNNATNKQNISQKYSEQFRIQAFLAEELLKRYQNVELTLHPSILDIRPFLWVNYGNDLPKYVSAVRYTSYVDISDFMNSETLSDIELFKNASSSRRQQIRYAIKKNYNTKIVNDAKLFIHFYEETFKRQNLDVKKKVLEEMENLITNLLKEETARLYASYDDKDEIGSMALFGWDNKRAYYLLGASDPNKRNGHTGTSVLWDAFKDLSSLNIKEIDLEGINSPHRGWFKLSFGGNIIPYYEVKYSAN